MADGLFHAMFSMEVNSKSGVYRVTDDANSLENYKSEDLFILIDNRLKVPSYLYHSSKIIAVESNESFKTLQATANLIEQFSQLGMNKKSVLIAIGGGAIQDVATLLCSIYMRGIQWIYIPTTLMSMADSCIGGKSSINVGQVKNLVGNFYPPELIFLDYSYIETLNSIGKACGLLEGVKICFAKDNQISNDFISYSKAWLKNNDINSLRSLVELSLCTKKWFIEVDEFDTAERKLLNFGHSFGHALESATKMKINHGLAIGLGMLVAMEISQKNADLEEFINWLLGWSNFQFKDLEFDDAIFRESLKKDKKNSSNIQRLVLLNHNGGLELVELALEETKLASQCNVMLNVLRGQQ